MSDFDIKNIDDFVKMIREIVIDVIKDMDTNTEHYYNGAVTSVSDDGKFASVDIGDKTLANLPNKTGETLSVSSYVRVYTTTQDINRGMTNAYIGRKLK